VCVAVVVEAELLSSLTGTETPTSRAVGNVRSDSVVESGVGVGVVRGANGGVEGECVDDVVGAELLCSTRATSSSRVVRICTGVKIATKIMGRGNIHQRGFLVFVVVFVVLQDN
jgi:hypothetical protein